MFLTAGLLYYNLTDFLESQVSLLVTSSIDAPNTPMCDDNKNLDTFV